MQAPSGQMTTPALQALLKDGALAGQWVLDPRTSSIRLKSRVMGLVPVNGVFRQVSGNGTVISADAKGHGPVLARISRRPARTTMPPSAAVMAGEATTPR